MELTYQNYDQNSKKMSMSFQQYDENVEKMKGMETRTVWPDTSQMEIFEKDPEKWIFFLIYLYEYGIKPKNKEEEYSRRSVNLFLQEHLLLFDDEDFIPPDIEKAELSSALLKGED